MSDERPSRSSGSSSRRLKNARDAVLNTTAGALLNAVRSAICEPTRSQIVRVLSAGPLSVGDLATILERSKSATSQHLRVLRQGGMVTANRRGRAIVYQLTSEPMVSITVEVLDRAASVAAA